MTIVFMVSKFTNDNSCSLILGYYQWSMDKISRDLSFILWMQRMSILKKYFFFFCWQSHWKVTRIRRKKVLWKKMKNSGGERKAESTRRSWRCWIQLLQSLSGLSSNKVEDTKNWTNFFFSPIKVKFQTLINISAKKKIFFNF